MKPLIKILILSFALATLPGCALLYSLDKDLDKQVDSWIKENEFTKAMDALNLVRPSHPKYKILQKKKNEVQNAAVTYEKNNLKKADELITQQRWDEAEKILNVSMEKLPDSDKIQTAYQEFIKIRATYLKSLYYQLYINKAEWLVKNKDVNIKLERVLPKNRDTKIAIDQHKQEIQHVYQQLIVCGIEGMNIDDLDLAEQCFLLANELKPSSEIKATLVDVQRQLSKLENRKTVKLSNRGRHLLDKSKQSMQAGKLKQAVDIYGKIPGTDKRHGLVKSYKQELDRRINQNVTQGIEVGRKLYSQGEVEQALAIWNELMKLAPDNEYLISHIDRAKRVLEKLLKLRNQDTIVIPPLEENDTKS